MELAILLITFALKNCVVACFLFVEKKKFVRSRFCRTDGNKTAELSDDLRSYGIVEIHMLQAYFISMAWYVFVSWNSLTYDGT